MLQHTERFLWTGDCFHRISWLFIVVLAASFSISGFVTRVYSLNEVHLLWKLLEWGTPASSTMEVEFVACYEASNYGIWLRNFITGMQIVNGIERPLKIYCDNKSAELYSKNNWSLSKSKHIDFKFLAVKERIQSRLVSTEHISTDSMIADPLTKGLPPKVFHGHVAHMGVVKFDDESF